MTRITNPVAAALLVACSSGGVAAQSQVENLTQEQSDRDAHGRSHDGLREELDVALKELSKAKVEESDALRKLSKKLPDSALKELKQAKTDEREALRGVRTVLEEMHDSSSSSNWSKNGKEKKQQQPQQQQPQQQQPQQQQPQNPIESHEDHHIEEDHDHSKKGHGKKADDNDKKSKGDKDKKNSDDDDGKTDSSDDSGDGKKGSSDSGDGKKGSGDSSDDSIDDPIVDGDPGLEYPCTISLCIWPELAPMEDGPEIAGGIGGDAGSIGGVIGTQLN